MNLESEYLEAHSHTIILYFIFATISGLVIQRKFITLTLEILITLLLCLMRASEANMVICNMRLKSSPVRLNERLMLGDPSLLKSVKKPESVDGGLTRR